MPSAKAPLALPVHPDSSAPVRSFTRYTKEAAQTAYAEPPDAYLCQGCRNEAGRFPRLIRWPTPAIPVSTVPLANKSPFRGRWSCHTTHYQRRGASRAPQPTVNLRCEIGRRLRVGWSMRHTSSQANTQHEARERRRAGGHRTQRDGKQEIAVRHHPGCKTRQTTSRCPAFRNQRRQRDQTRQVCHRPNPASPRRQLLNMRPKPYGTQSRSAGCLSCAA